MTYAGELFSWFAGSVKADVYFCPERHGTYFGGFFLKDYPAMGNHGYKISTSLTGDKGRDFLKILSPVQADILRQVLVQQEPVFKKITEIRTSLAVELRKALINEIPHKDSVYSLMKMYGSLDGELSYRYAMAYAEIYKSLTAEQKDDLYKLRDLDVIPEGAYLFSDMIDTPKDINTDFLFR